MRPLRIAMVSEHASPLAVLGGVDAGGQNVHVAALAEGLACRGHDVVVHTRRDDPSAAGDVVMGPNLSVHHVDAGPPRALPKDDLFRYMDDFADQLVERWRWQRPDIVHSHFWMSGYAATRAAATLDVPVVHTFHALGVVKRRHQGRKDTSPARRLTEEQMLLDRCDRIVATCSDEVFELLQIGAWVDVVRVVPCGVDTTVFAPDGPREAPARWGHRLVCIGRLVERKGIGTAIEALARIPGTELVIAGGPAPGAVVDDPDVGRLRRIAETHGVVDRVDFRGRMGRGELPALLRSADAVVCVPWYEPFGIVPLEAMACGVPVVASAVGGLVDTVVDGMTGRLVPPRDVDQTATVLAELLADPDLRRQMGCNGAARVGRRFTWERVAEETLAVYDDVLAQRRAASASVHPIEEAAR